MNSKEEKDFYEGVIYRANKKLHELEKELRQTKSNFKNSQTHSKNCYKKLKAKFLKFEKENQELKEDLEESFDYNALRQLKINSLEEENTKLEKALEKSCEKLEYTCPVEEELIDDLDCENCKDNYKECWKKFFLKEVFEDE